MAEYGEVGNSVRDGQAQPQKSYAEYLELQELLALQRPLSEPPVHDEMLFIIVHQTHELWFKQIIFELRALIGQIDARSWDAAERTVDRVSAIVGLLIAHVEVLETMPTQEFQRFRGVLGSASGMQSEQFKQIEELATRLPCVLVGPVRAGPLRDAESRSVREAFSRAVGAVIPANDGTSMAASLGSSGTLPGPGSIFREPRWARERELAERLLRFDAEMARWRTRHMALARAMISDALGTGGSTGARYLEGTLDKRFFPELSAARAEATVIGEATT